MEMDKPRTKVEVGKVVTVVFEDQELMNVCIMEKKPMLDTEIKFISPNAPLAKAILNHTEGEEVIFETPAGKLVVEITKINPAP